MRKLGKWTFSFIHQSWFLVAVCVGIVIGVILGMVFRVNFFGSFYWVLGSVTLFIIGYLRPRAVFMVLMVMVGMVLAFFRITTELHGEDYIRGLLGYDVIVSGIVAGDPEVEEGGVKYKIVDLEFGEERMRATGSIFVMGNGNSEGLMREDIIVLSGRLENGFGTFIGSMYRPKVLKWERAEPGSWVLKVRNWFAGRVFSLISEPEVKLGLSYLLGMKAGLPEELEEKLRVVGLTHIVVASGAHLAILVEIARKIFGKLSRMMGLLASLIFIVFFMAMVGWTPSILRAGIMTILSLLAWYSGRVFAPWRIILIVMAATLMINPGFMVDMGWQLSFASYAGIMIIAPRMTKFFYGIKKPGFVGSMIIATVAATIMTLPIILYHYGMVSLISVVANLLILPTLPYAMGLVFLTGAFAGMPVISAVISWGAEMLLKYHIMIVSWFGEMQQFLIEIPKYQMWVFGIYVLVFVILIMVIFGKYRKRSCYNNKYEQ